MIGAGGGGCEVEWMKSKAYWGCRGGTITHKMREGDTDGGRERY